MSAPRKQYRKGDPARNFAADDFNAIAAEVERWANLKAIAPLAIGDGPGGRYLTRDGEPSFYAKLSGASSPYAWTEQVETASGVWADGERSGTDAYEVNSRASLSGKVARLYPTAFDHRFRYIRSGSGGTPPCLGTITISAIDACSLATLTGSAGVTITVKDSLGVTVGTSTTTPYTLANLPMGVYTITAVGGSGYTAAVSPSTVTLSTCGSTATATVTRTRSDTFYSFIELQGAGGCCPDGASVTFSAAGGYTFTTSVFTPVGLTGFCTARTPDLDFVPANMGPWTLTGSAPGYTTTSWATYTMGCGSASGSYRTTRPLPWAAGMWDSPHCLVAMPASVTITIGNVAGGTNPVANPGTYTCAYVPGTDGTFLSACTLIGGQKYRYSFIRGTSFSGGGCVNGWGGTVAELRWNGLNPGFATCSGTATSATSIAMTMSSAADGCASSLNLAGADANVSGSVTP